ncbi:MAG: cytochrome c peroxidase [Myxococcota bacterium]|nr:cytochrome c peroxidase [Myxococcota bacterium]
MLKINSAIGLGALLLYSLSSGCHTQAEQARDQTSSPLVELGRHLFYERRLSFNNDRSCGICHEQAKGFTDGFVRAVGTTGAIHPRNTLTLLNVSERRTLSWVDPSPVSLAQQLLVPLLGTEPIEMGAAESIDDMLDELNGDHRYQQLLVAAGATALDLDLLALSIAAFVSSLTTYDAPYDRFLAGDETAIDEVVKRGEALFYSRRTLCSSCHGGADFDQPMDGRHGWFNTGLYSLETGTYPSSRQGLYELTGQPSDIGRFRVPTLRHLALTKPYYHDGTGATLRDVLEHYNAGGRLITSGPFVGDGRTNPYKDPRIRPLHLTDSELDDLEAFLLALSDISIVDRMDWSDPWIRGD